VSAILRDYQLACREAVLGALGEKPWHKEGETFRSVLINLATSGGKTVTSGDLINILRERGKCLFLADTDELCEQPRTKFHRFFGITAAVEKAEFKASRHADVVVGSAQSLARENRIRRFNPDHFQYIFVDEAHRGSDRNKKITDYFDQAKLIGLTATPFRAKLADLSDFYEHVAFEMGVFDLIDEGYQTPLKVMTLPVVVNIAQVHQSMSTEGMDYDKAELEDAIEPYYEKICEMILEHAPERHIICYLPLIKSSQKFVEIAMEAGINAYHIDGDSPNRRELLKSFDRGEIQLLSNSSLLTTGWDCPRCDCLLNLAPTRSAGLFRQKAGRIGRVLPDVIDGITDRDERKRRIAASAKPDALILDLLWQTERFGLMGPADLIAANAEERAAVQLRLSRLNVATDLQDVTSAVQAEREKALKTALEEAAKRQARLADAADIALVAATLHGRKILNYEPVMKWEAKPISPAQKDWMERNGMNPATAKDRGHVSALMNLLFQRQRAGLTSWKVVAALEARGIQDATRISDRRAYEILDGDYPFPFGKYARLGMTLRQVPEKMLAWCSDPSRAWMEKQYPVLWDWIQRKLHNKEKGRNASCTCIGSYQAPNCPVHPRVKEMGDEERHMVTADLFDIL
jgi:superfamily II DNA or RNA helicase